MTAVQHSRVLRACRRRIDTAASRQCREEGRGSTQAPGDPGAAALPHAAAGGRNRQRCVCGRRRTAVQSGHWGVRGGCPQRGEQGTDGRQLALERATCVRSTRPCTYRRRTRHRPDEFPRNPPHRTAHNPLVPTIPLPHPQHAGTPLKHATQRRRGVGQKAQNTRHGWCPHRHHRRPHCTPFHTQTLTALGQVPREVRAVGTPQRGLVSHF